MKTKLHTAGLLTAILLASNPVYADATKEENIGFLSGAVAGAAVGGPVGFLVGAVTGTIFGNQVDKANQLGETNEKLLALNEQSTNLKTEIKHYEMMVASHNEEIEELKRSIGLTNAAWLTENLTMNLLFTTNSSKLSDKDLNTVERISKVLKRFPDLIIRLDGFADPRGTEKHNLNLSNERIIAVRDAFKSFGVTRERIVSFSHGETVIEASKQTRDNYALERKVMINFVQQQASVAQN